MVSNKFDVLDTPFVAIYALMGTLTTGIASYELFGYDLTATLVSAVGLDVSLALILSVVSLTAVGFLGEFSYTEAETPFRAVLGVTGGVMLLSAWVPEVNQAIIGSDIIGVAVFTLYTGAIATVSYLG